MPSSHLRMPAVDHQVALDTFLSDEKFEENLLPLHTHGDFLIPGRGQVSNPRHCGKFRKGYYSGVSGIHTLFHCNLRKCPVCYRVWGRRLALKATAFVFEMMKRAERVYHCVWSPDADRFIGWKGTIRRMHSFLKKFHAAVSNTGVPVELGYCYVKHPVRLKCSVCGVER